MDYTNDAVGAFALQMTIDQIVKKNASRAYTETEVKELTFLLSDFGRTSESLSDNEFYHAIGDVVKLYDDALKLRWNNQTKRFV
jgi:hypothetical protein